MKIFLNDRKIKESSLAITCFHCACSRDVEYNPYARRCLMRTFNLRNDHDWCFKGYVYEDMA